MNLIITNVCNRNCPYCFAKSEETGNKFISLENVEYYINFLKKSNIRDLKILGGEPTLHPELPEIIRLGRKNGFSIGVFTNGLWPGPIQEYFRKNKDDKVVFLFNVNEPSKQKPMENSRQLQSLKIAGRQATLGFNIYHEDFNLLFVEELIISLSLKRKVRLGLASPIVKAKNAYLENSALKRVGKRLVQQLCELEKKDILGSLDCGFPLCMFDESDLGSLSLTLQSGFRIRMKLSSAQV